MIKIKKLKILKEYLKDNDLCEYEILFNNRHGIMSKIWYNNKEYDFRMLENSEIQKVYDLEFSLYGKYDVTNDNKNPIKFLTQLHILLNYL